MSSQVKATERRKKLTQPDRKKKEIKSDVAIFNSHRWRHSFVLVATAAARKKRWLQPLPKTHEPIRRRWRTWKRLVKSEFHSVSVGTKAKRGPPARWIQLSFVFGFLFCFVLFRNGRVHILLFSEPAVSASESRVRFREFPPLDHRSGGDGWLEHLRVAARNRDVTATPAPAAAAAPTTTTRRWWKTRRSSAFRSCSGGFCRPVVGFQVRASPVAKT